MRCHCCVRFCCPLHCAVRLKQSKELEGTHIISRIHLWPQILDQIWAIHFRKKKLMMMIDDACCLICFRCADRCSGSSQIFRLVGKCSEFQTSSRDDLAIDLFNSLLFVVFSMQALANISLYQKTCFILLLVSSIWFDMFRRVSIFTGIRWQEIYKNPGFSQSSVEVSWFLFPFNQSHNCGLPIGGMVSNLATKYRLALCPRPLLKEDVPFWPLGHSRFSSLSGHFWHRTSTYIILLN